MCVSRETQNDAEAAAVSAKTPPDVGASVSRETPARETGAGVSRETFRAYGLSQAQERQLDLALATLAEDEHAPTTVREPRRARGVHAADSLVALDVRRVAGASKIADIGSGAGFPGVALAIALPDAHVSLIESQGRKCAFLERLLAAAQVGNAEVVCSRVEEWRDGLTRFDVVLARALAAQAVVLEYAAPLLRVGGTLVDWRGGRDPAGERAAGQAGAILGLRMVEVRSVSPFEGSGERHLYVFEKVEETPDRFPRRVGVARKRPLGR